jgi:Raf kinase inhibitor-like YbhB/YbcL family protein
MRKPTIGFVAICLAVLTILPGTVRMAAAAEEAMAIQLKSSAFAEGKLIPIRYTCDGADISAPLAWSGLPAGTKSLALVCDDPDAPRGTWVHWVVYDLPGTLEELPEGVAPTPDLEQGGRQGRNSFGHFGYGGPCPPSGTHRYFFRLYALDAFLDLPSGIAKDRLLRAMNGHILGEAELMGRYHH